MCCGTAGCPPEPAAACAARAAAAPTTQVRTAFVAGVLLCLALIPINRLIALRIQVCGQLLLCRLAELPMRTAYMPLCLLQLLRS